MIFGRLPTPSRVKFPLLRFKKELQFADLCIENGYALLIKQFVFSILASNFLYHSHLYHLERGM